MKRVEFKSVDLGSVFKLFAGMSFVLGFVVALFTGGFANTELSRQFQSIPFIGTLMNGFVGAILFGLLTALLNGLCGVLGAVIYNIFAMIFGGIEMEVNEKN